MNTRTPWHRLAGGLVAVLLLVVAAVPLLARSVHAQRSHPWRSTH